LWRFCTCREELRAPCSRYSTLHESCASVLRQSEEILHIVLMRGELRRISKTGAQRWRCCTLPRRRTSTTAGALNFSGSFMFILIPSEYWVPHNEESNNSSSFWSSPAFHRVFTSKNGILTGPFLHQTSNNQNLTRVGRACTELTVLGLSLSSSRPKAFHLRRDFYGWSPPNLFAGSRKTAIINFAESN
jgi:hypothetical protein